MPDSLQNGSLDIILSLDNNYLRCRGCGNHFHKNNTKDHILSIGYPYSYHFCIFCFSITYRHDLRTGFILLDMNILQMCYHPEKIPFHNLTEWENRDMSYEMRQMSKSENCA